jgi:DNA-binding GntR family transcriptional regulator
LSFKQFISGGWSVDRYFKVSKRKPIERETLAGKATVALRNMIITGEFPPAAKITEISLAEAIGVSRACIREAVITLEQEGLLTKVQNHYTQVVQFSASDVDEICELRLAIETMALRKSMARRNLNLERLDQHVQQLIDSMNLKSSDTIIHWLEDDMAFHREIVAAAGNQRVLVFWESLSNQVVAMLYMAHRIHPELIARPTDTHAQIVRAIRQDDPDEATRLLQEHITSSVSWVKLAVAFRDQPTEQDG